MMGVPVLLRYGGILERDCLYLEMCQVLHEPICDTVLD